MCFWPNFDLKSQSHAALQALPPRITMERARVEAEIVMFESIEKTLKKAGIRPNQVPPAAEAANIFMLRSIPGRPQNCTKAKHPNSQIACTNGTAQRLLTHRNLLQERLQADADMVTQRWLSEGCQGRQLVLFFASSIRASKCQLADSKALTWAQ